MDADGVCGDVDLCPSATDPLQENADGDEFGDACDACPNDPDNDADGDCVCAGEDICPGFDDNGPDADGDGMPDACDPCAAGAATGDTDANGRADLSDHASLAPCLAGPGSGLGDGCECFDFDDDGDNDLGDFAAFQRLFNESE